MAEVQLEVESVSNDCYEDFVAEDQLDVELETTCVHRLW